MTNRTLEQHIAVFGEGGSGKTVLPPSFYGATQEPKYRQEHAFHVLADKISDGTRLHQNYLGEVSRRVGLDLVLPLAAMLPFERHVRWSKTMQLPRRVAENLLDRSGAVAAALLSRALRLPGPVGLVMGLFGPNVVDDALRVAGDQLKALNAEAVARHDHLTATLTRFRLDLDEGERARVLLRSVR